MRPRVNNGDIFFLMYTTYYLGIHGSSCWLFACDRAQRFLAVGAVWVKLKSFMDAVVAKCVTTFGLNRIIEGFKADCTRCIKKDSVGLKIYNYKLTHSLLNIIHGLCCANHGSVLCVGNPWSARTRLKYLFLFYFFNPCTCMTCINLLAS